MNPVIAAAAVKAGKDTLGYASKVGQAVIDSPENQEELERKLKLPKGSIQKMADGEEDPKLSTVIGIADVLGTSLDKLTGYVNKKSEQAKQKREAREAASATEEEARRALENLKEKVAGMNIMAETEDAHQTANDISFAIDEMLNESSKEKKSIGREIVMKYQTANLSMDLAKMAETRRDPQSLKMIEQTRESLNDIIGRKEANREPVKKGRATGRSLPPGDVPFDVVARQEAMAAENVGVMDPKLMKKLGVKPGDTYNGMKVLEPTSERMAVMDDLRNQTELDVVRDIKKREAATRYQTKVQRANDQAEQKGLSTSVESEVYDGPDFDG